MSNEDEILLEVDGPGISPETIDSLIFLRLAATWFQLVANTARLHNEPISLSGVRVIDKCAALKLTASDAIIAKRNVTRALRLVRGEDSLYGVEGHVEELRRQLRALPPQWTTNVHVGNDVQALDVGALQGSETPFMRLELRVTAVRAAVINPPYAHLVSESEDPRPFRVSTTLEEAQKLGALLGKELDVVISAARNDEGRIENARLIEIHELDTSEPTPAWRQWFADNANEWDDVEDIGGELGRGLD